MLKINIERKVGQKPLDITRLHAALDGAAIEVQKEAKSLCPVNLGPLRSSIIRAVDVPTATVGTNVVYAPFVEYGTGPHFPPLEPLKEWAKRVLGDEDAAYPIALKIAKYGTRPQSFLRAGLDVAKDKALSVFKKILFGGV